MKINWTNLVIILIILFVLIGVGFGIKKYLSDKTDIGVSNSLVDSLQLVIINQDKNILDYRLRQQRLEEEKLQLINSYKHLKNRYYAEKDNEDDYYILPVTDSAKLSVLSEYFIEQNIPLYYSR